MTLPESLRIGQGPSAPQTDALRMTVKGSTGLDSRPFWMRLQVHQRRPSAGTEADMVGLQHTLQHLGRDTGGMDHQTPQISFDILHSRTDSDGERTHRIPGGEHDGWLLQDGA